MAKEVRDDLRQVLGLPGRTGFHPIPIAQGLGDYFPENLKIIFSHEPEGNSLTIVYGLDRITAEAMSK